MSLNSIYITVGGLIIAVFLAALAGPWFIDWNSYRPAFERQAERLVGQDVKVLGEAEIYLLPTPYATFTDVRVGDADNPLMIISRFSARIELPPLLKGEIRVIDMTLERPDIRVALDADGRLATLGGAPDGNHKIALAPDAIAFDKIDIVDGTLRISNALSGRVDTIDDIDMAISARSLRGPFRADGTARIDGEPSTIDIATGSLDSTGALRVKTRIDPTGRPFALLADGPLHLTDGVPEYTGSFTLDRPVPPPAEPSSGKAGRLDRAARETPWRAEGDFTLGGDKLSLDTLAITYGPEDRRLSLSGHAALTMENRPRFDIALSAKQVDLDRMFSAPTSKPGPAASDSGSAPPPAASRRTAEALDALAEMPLPTIDGQLHIDIGGLVLAGGALQSVSLDASPAVRGWRVDKLAAQLPGRTALTFSGDLTLQNSGDLRIESDIDLDVAQPNGLVAWWRGSDILVGSALDPFRLSGRLTAGTDGVALTQAKLETQRSLARGEIVWQPANGSKRASFSLDVTADRLESEQLAAAARLAFADKADDKNPSEAPAAGTDIYLRVVSDKLLVGDVEAAGVEAGLSYADGALTIDRLVLADVAGARIVADGTVRNIFTLPDGNLDIAITAKKLNGLASLVIDAFPGSDLARRLMSASSLLAPAVLSAQFSGQADDDRTNATLHVSGEAGGSDLRLDTTFTGRIDRWREGEISLDGTLSGPDGPHLLGQLGFDVLPVGTEGKARIAVTAKGRPDDTLHIEATAEMAASTLTGKGTTTVADTGTTYAFDVALKSPDLAPLALMTGRVLPVLAGAVPSDLTARIEGEDTRFSVPRFSGSLAGATFSGKGKGDLTGTTPAVGGDVALDSLDMAFLSELILGADVWSGISGDAAPNATDGGRWPSVPFGTPLLGAVNADFAVSAGSVSLAPGLALDNARFRLSLGPADLALDQVSGTLLGGKASGTIQLKRSGGAAGLSATAHITGGNVAALISENGDTPPLTGTFDLAADVESTGRSIAALVAGLAGSGTVTIRDVTVAGFGGDAFTAVITAVDDGTATNVGGIDENAVHAVFAKAFTAGRSTVDRIEGVISIASGTVWARNIRLMTPALTALGTVSLDLGTLARHGEWTVEPRHWQDTVEASAPRASITHTGEDGTDALTIDVTPLLSYLNLRAYELEQRRVDHLNQEILERERLGRELRRQREARERRERQAREAAEAAAEARKKKEDERKAAEERRKADEARRRADEAAKRAIRDAGKATEGLVAPSGDDDFADRIGDAIERSRQNAPQNGGQRGTNDPNALPPLPQAIEIAPPPGSEAGSVPPGVRAPSGTAHTPLSLVPSSQRRSNITRPQPQRPQPQRPETQRPETQLPRPRYIERPDGSLIILPN